MLSREQFQLGQDASADPIASIAVEPEGRRSRLPRLREAGLEGAARTMEPHPDGGLFQGDVPAGEGRDGGTARAPRGEIEAGVVPRTANLSAGDDSFGERTAP
jgi:hypothetical protein